MHGTFILRYFRTIRFNERTSFNVSKDKKVINNTKSRSMKIQTANCKDCLIYNKSKSFTLNKKTTIQEIFNLRHKVNTIRKRFINI